MPLPASLQQSIVAVSEIMAGAHDPWWIISGAAVALHGAEGCAVSDVDVVLSVDDARRLFARIGVRQEPPSADTRFRSEVFGRCAQFPLIVEFMANFAVRDSDGVWRSAQPVTRQAVEVVGATVFVPEVQELRSMFKRFGRDKDHQRIRLLDQLA